MLLLLTGPSGSGKTYRILSEFREAVRARRKGFRLVVPTATLATHLAHQLAREGLVFSPRSIVTLAGFTSEICPDLELADNVMLTLAAETAALEVNAPEFERVSRMPGFHAALVSTIGELDGAGCTPEQFAQIRPESPFARPLLAVWRHMDRQLKERGLLTRSQMLRRTAGVIRAEGSAQRVWFDGFMGFARPELEVIEALAAKADVTVALPPLTTAIGALADLRAAGFTFEEMDHEGPPGDATWFQAENLEREADEIARRILLYQESGNEFRDIAVVLRNTEDASLLETTFERFGIPTRSYFSGALADHPVAGFGMRLMEALLSGWDLEATLAAMRLMPGLAPSALLDQWDVKIRELIPGRGLVGPAERFGALDSWREARWSGERWADVLGEIPGRFAPPQPRDGTSWNETRIERSQAAASKAWADAMQRAAKWIGLGTFVRLEEFWRTASAVVRLSSLNVPDGRRNVVHVMSVYEARQWNPAVMFLPNLTEKIFPRYHAQDPFLPDSAIRTLKEAGVRMRDSKDRDAEESCLFDAVAARRGQVCLSYPRRNGRGDENLRSSFLSRVRASESQVMAARPAAAMPPVAMRAPVRVEIGERHAYFTPSGLEAYARCPFQFFAGRTLKLGSLPDTPADRLSYLVQGTIVHDVLRQWTSTRGEVGPIFDAVFDAVCKDEHIQSTYLTEVLRRQMLGALEGFCERFETYGESEAERKFDLEVLPGVELRGRIDRVDMTESGGAVIIDYKYSAQLKQNVDDESKLQGVLYTIAAQRKLNLKPQATVFLSLKKEMKPVGWGDLPGLKLAPITSDWLEKGLETVGRMTSEIRDGVVQARPSDLRHCEYCDFRDACRYEGAEAVRGA